MLTRTTTLSGEERLGMEDAIEVLGEAARSHAAKADAASALACYWVADLCTVQRLVRQSASDDHTTTRHETFALWESIVEAMSSVPVGSGTLVDVVTAHRVALIDVVRTAGFTMDESDLMGIDALAGLPALSDEDLQAAARFRLGGMDADRFIAERRRESIDQMIRSQRALADGQVAAAISHAYDSDMAALDAYLTESCLAAGDTYLFTWLARWELVSARIAAVPSLPHELSTAIKTVRTAIAEALGEPDASRMLASLQSV